MIGGIEVNYLVILVSAIISFIIGALWYSLLFGKSWTKLMGFSAKDIEKTKKKSMAKTYFIGFIAQLIMATDAGTPSGQVKQIVFATK